MIGTQVATLGEFGEVLADGGFRIVDFDFRSTERAILAESPYALVGCMEVDDWSALRQDVEDFQAELTRIAAQPLSARRWDLYVVTHVRARAGGPADESLAESIEADTRYARKFVRVALPPDRSALERALRPLLPLHSMPEFDGFEPLEAIRQELRALAVPDDLADEALDAFAQTNEVSVP